MSRPNLGHLQFIEDTAQVQKAGLAEEMGDLLPVLVDRKGSIEIERRSVEIRKANVSGLVDLAAVEKSAQHGLPADPLIDRPRFELDARRHGEPRRRLIVLDKVRERVRRQAGDDACPRETALNDQNAGPLTERHLHVADFETERR